jgi:hypothetical protein
MENPHTDEADLLRHAEAGHQEALAALHTRYADRIARCIQQYCTRAEHSSAIAPAAWEEVQRQLPSANPTPTCFADLVHVCTQLTILRYYACPTRWNATIVGTLSRELQQTPSACRPAQELAELLLVIQAQQGDAAAFDQLWEQHGKMALGFLRVHVGSNNVAEDLLTTLWLLL